MSSIAVFLYPSGTCSVLYGSMLCPLAITQDVIPYSTADSVLCFSRSHVSVSLNREQAEDNDSTWVGHINSLGVLRTYRRLGLAKRLMTLSSVYSLRIMILLLH